MDREKYMTMARAFVLFWAGFWSFLAIGIFFFGQGRPAYGVFSMLAVLLICFISWKNPKRGSLVFIAITLVFSAFGLGILLLYPSGPGGIFFSALTVIFPLGAALFFNKARTAKLAEPFNDGFGEQDA